MEQLFTYKEFISMMKNYGIKHKKRKLKCGENIMTNSTEPNSVILLLNGYISSYTCESPEKLLSVFEPGIFLRYSILEELPPIVTNIALSDDCVVYEYKKEDIEYALSLFPENFGFQYFFLKKIGRHLYYRALLNGKNHHEKLYYAIKYLGILIGKKDENGNILLPPEVTIKILIEYSTLSKAAFYRQRIRLLEQEILKQHKKTFIVQKKVAKHYEKQLTSI
ncbi:Crp/Fnr family transcriptional regulator [Listeria monocytogenes]|uniref:Crp/Fnr family transcriptional regulator n=1 Tax=Listeria monocytogenes TaxID=1639 RepID=UPI000F14ED3A|nr:Crp/Fnr family transcriptional regulator [Listeria monocytogenes]EAC8502896.1 Crp/Fnr family transcriptional regulator [Listeria monocytogenes]EAD0634514.1 Crp/Fnr family transcriptional regulator [Listeria monocytogenes]EAD2137335.1 Crp/Fnr family transcriptional regulator [Listeria monocytogenes]EAD2761759.1 Crp/Fnr family transcriptional regulator [Listeria monocytogenes]EAD3287490.1 Crp/Fnr family transcriptional regulator [Listeria monocytogenes]